MVCQKQILIVLLSWCLLGSTAVAQSLGAPAGVLAKAGETYIFEKEFLERFELIPGLQRHREGRLEEAKLELLYSLIAEKLMAQEARERKLDQDSTFAASFDDVRKMLARDELYRREVSGKVSVSSAEISTGISQALKEVLISFIYDEKKEDASFLRSRMKSGMEFDRLAIDTSFHAVRDTATVIWSDADPAIERAAYSMKEGEISPVLHAGTGYYIIKVQRVQRSSFYSSLQPSVLRERVEAKIRERKEQSRLNEYVSSALKNKTGFARPLPLKRLALALVNVFPQDKIVGKTALSSSMTDAVRSECQAILRDTLAVAGSVRWTVGQVIDRLFNKGFAVDSSNVRDLPRVLNGQLRVWVQQELLGQEALARSLDKYPAVREQLDTWYDNFLEQSMRFYIKRQAHVSEAEVLSFMQSKDSAVVVPRVRIQELKTATLDDMQKALNELQVGRSIEEVIVRWCSDPELRKRKGISDPLPISERYPIGEIAWQMLVGQRYGPVKDSSGYLYFELLAKDQKRTPNDTAFAARKEASTKELLRQKEKRLLNLFLARSGETRGYMIYQDRLSALKVSTVPMMTFRILGFGGRMFAVPFVDRQVEWLNVEPPAGKILFNP